MLTSFAACAGEPALEPPDGGGEGAFLPADVSSWQEVRACRRSADHDLLYVRILANPEAAPTYLARDRPFVEGAIVAKVQYFDPGCSEVRGYTAMRRVAAGQLPAQGDWDYQQLSVTREIEAADLERCVSCHAACGQPPDGFDGTCAAP